MTEEKKNEKAEKEKPKAKAEKEAKESKPEKPKEEKPADVFEVKTMIDGDFRFPSKLREAVDFGNHTALKVKVLKLQPKKFVELRIERA